MKKPIDPQKNTYQLIIGIGDYHDKTHPVNAEQRTYLESFIKNCRKAASKVIVEDLSSINNDGKGVCCNFAINAYGGVLGTLADIARLQSVDVDNVEYRFCRVAGIGPLLNNRVVRTTRALPSNAINSIPDETRQRSLNSSSFIEVP